MFLCSLTWQAQRYPSEKVSSVDLSFSIYHRPVSNWPRNHINHFCFAISVAVDIQTFLHGNLLMWPNDRLRGDVCIHCWVSFPVMVIFTVRGPPLEY